MIHNITTLETKDWARMRDLIIKNKKGTSVATSIKDLRKAIARFVAGNKLNCVNLSTITSFYNKNGNFCDSLSAGIFFEDFGNRALELGAKITDIIAAYTKASVPRSFDVAGLPISDPTMAEKSLKMSLGLKGLLSELPTDALQRVSFQ